MTNNDSVVEQIVRSLSFEVIAVPTEKIVESCSSKSTPLNVKIKVKKKDGHSQQGVLATSKLGPDGVPQRIRLVNSDYTTMSFNVVMEDAEFVKPVSSRKAVIPNLLIHPGTHDGPYNEPTNQTYKADIKESRISQSDGALKSTFTLSKVEDDKRFNTSSKAQKKDIFGKCKPGGCLDPPFGEDNYSYEPARESLPNQENVNTTRPRTSSIFSNNFFNKKKKTKPDKSSAGRSGPKPDEQDSILSLYQGDSLQTSVTISNSLITYPSMVYESDIKQKSAARNYESISKKSIDLNSGSLYIIPRKNKVSTELKDSPNLDQKELNFTPIVVIPQENDTYVKPIQHIPSPDSHKELESSDFVTAAQKMESQNQNNTAETLLTSYSIAAPDSTKDFIPHIVSETSQFNEETSYQKDFAETSQDIKGLVTTGIISAGVMSMVVADKEKLQETAANPNETIEEKTSSDVLIETERKHVFTLPSDGNDKDSRHSETLIMKPSLKSVDDNIENLSIMPRTVTESKSIEQDEEDSTAVPKSGKTEKDDNMDYVIEKQNNSSDILLKEYSVPTGEEEFKYENQDQETSIMDDTDNESQARTVSALGRSVVSNTVSEDIKTNKVNSIATVDIDLHRDWKDGKETIDFNISIARNSADILHDELSPPIHAGHDKIIPLKGKDLGEDFKYDEKQDPASWVTDDVDNQNRFRTDSQSEQVKSNTVSEDLETIDSSIDKKSAVALHDTSSHLFNDKIMPLKGRNLGEDTNNLKQTKSEGLEINKQNSVGTVHSDSQRDWKDAKELGAKNGLEQTQSQELLNKSMRDSDLDKDKIIYRDEDSIRTKNESNDLNGHTPTDSFKERKSDSSSIVSTLKDKPNVNNDFLKDKISKQNESILSDNKKEGNFEQPTLAQDYHSLLKEKLKLKDVKESDSKTDNFDKHDTRDKENDVYSKKGRDSDNVSKRSKSSVSFDDIVLKKTDIKKLKSTTEINKQIKIDLGFHSYTTDKNEIIIKSFDSKTVLNRHPKDAIIMTSCNVRDPFEMKVPIDNTNLLLIQVKNNSIDDSDVKGSSVLSKYSDRKANSPKDVIKTIQEANKHADVSKLSEVYEKVYENEFRQFHEMIKKLKQEVDVLIYQQNEFKENLRSKKMKQFKILQGNKRCCCSRKL